MSGEWHAFRAEFVQNAQALGRSDAFIESSLAYAMPLVLAHLPVIFDFAQLSALLGFDKNALRRALFADRDSLYHTSHIPKRSGGYRRIDAPVASLKEAQTWVLRNLLDKATTHPAALAFSRKRSIRHNALPHIKRTSVLSVDVREFFPSLRPQLVNAVFAGMGYAEDVAAALTALTTLGDGLPQGAPSSPSLSNLLLRGVDRSLHLSIRAMKCRYTRYADDITVSGVFSASRVIALIRSALEEVGLHLNDQKTRLMLRHQRQEVTGVVVNAKLQASREMRRELRHHVHMVQRFGIPRDVGTDPQERARYLDRLRGTAEFIRFLNPDDRDALHAIQVLGRVKF